jgi:hypothetical protein
MQRHEDADILFQNIAFGMQLPPKAPNVHATRIHKEQLFGDGCKDDNGCYTSISELSAISVIWAILERLGALKKYRYDCFVLSCSCHI